MKARRGIDINTVLDAAKKIRLIVLDVDGVLTDGGLYMDANGLAMKRFDVHDGVAVRIWKAAGFEIAVLSGMSVPCVERRLEMLNITLYRGGHDDKIKYLDEFRRQLELDWSDIAYVGDDWVDMTPMMHVGLPIAVANATPDTKDVALAITRRMGGHGAVREAIEFILDAKGLKQNIVEQWRHFE